MVCRRTSGRWHVRGCRQRNGRTENPQLQSLQWVGDLNRVEVSENPTLTTVDMVGLRDAVGGLDVRNNPALTSLEWRSSYALGSATVLENGGEEDLEVDLFADFPGEVLVRGNPGLATLSVSGTPGVSGAIRVQSNPKLWLLSLDTAKVLAGDLIVTDHPLLTSMWFDFLEDSLGNFCRYHLQEVQGA